MPIAPAVARPLLASMFVTGGLDALRHPDSKVKMADAVVAPLTARFPALPNDPRTFVRINGAVQVGAGTLLARGTAPRIASLVLIASLLPTTYAGHRFWEEADEGRRAGQRIHLLKNLGLLGGLVLSAAWPRTHHHARAPQGRLRTGSAVHASAVA
jgi:putative oxidoreductase